MHACTNYFMLNLLYIRILEYWNIAMNEESQDVQQKRHADRYQDVSNAIAQRPEAHWVSCRLTKSMGSVDVVN